MGVASAINDMVGKVLQKQRVVLTHYEDFLSPAALPEGGLDEAVRRALSAGEIKLIDSVSLEITGDLGNFKFSLPRGKAPGATEE